MASSSSNIPSNSASNENSESGENIKQSSIKINLSTLLNIFKWKLKISKRQQPTKENSPNSSEKTKESDEKTRKKDEKKKETEKQITAMSSLIRADFYSLENALKRIKKHEITLREAIKKFNELEDPNAKDLRDFKKLVKTLKQQISTHELKMGEANEKEELLNQIRSITLVKAQEHNEVQLKMMPNLFANTDFARTLPFQDFKAEYNKLPLELKLCLLCFSVFPESVEIKRRVMVYWWIGEGFVPPRKDRQEEKENRQHWDKFDLTKINPLEKDFKPEHWANHYFKILLNMGYIESAQKKPNSNVDLCKMHPFVRLMVSKIAREAEFFDFDHHGNVNDEFSKSLRACLFLNGTNLTNDDKLLKSLHAVFNVDESILDLKKDSLSKLRSANVLYLGRWQSLDTHHIEVDDAKILNAKKESHILDGLQNLKNLKFFSLQGISRITELPKSILKLRNLTILDLRACHNLEKIPNGIGCLVNLTHLDMSECHLLDEMPKGISLLTKLQVLSGFVVPESENKNSCTLGHLKDLSGLRKLSIHTGSDKFPLEKDLQALNQFKQLIKLTIAWGRASVNTSSEKSSENENKEDNRKELCTRNQDIDQSWKKDNGFQIREKNENSRETDIPGREGRKSDKGKEIINQGSTEFVKICKLSNQEDQASTSGQDLKKNKDNIKKNPDLALFSKTECPDNAQEPRRKGFKETVGRGLERLPSMRPVAKDPPIIIAKLPSQLTKLDLKCFPGKEQNWLRPEKLLNLEKLYIRGGKLSDLGQVQHFDDSSRKRKWIKVKELRLKYLDEIEMDWSELMDLFPTLDYLEMVDCPKLSIFPCDEIGVWTKNKTIS